MAGGVGGVVGATSVRFYHAQYPDPGHDCFLSCFLLRAAGSSFVRE